MLRTQIRGSSDCDSRSSQRFSTGGADCFRDSKIENQRLALEQHHVLGFDVAVYHAASVREIKRRSKRASKTNRFRRRKMLFAIDLVAQRLALDVRHHVKQHAARFAGVVHRDDVRMSEARYGFDFLKKSFGSQRCGDICVENLHRDTAIMPRVTRAVDGCHATSADLVLYGISVAECFLGSGCCQMSGWKTQ